MQNQKERGVLLGERVLHRSVKMLPDWEAAHLFLGLVRRGSFRAAANELGLSVNALRSRISSLEKSLGVTLVTRHIDGVRPTAEGRRAFALASEMERASFELIEACRLEEPIEGEVRVAVTEGLGGAWISSRVGEFQRAHPKLMTDIFCTLQSADVLRLETDVSIQLKRPTAQEVKVVKLGRLHLVPFAAPSYIERNGAPKSISDFAKHKITVQVDDDPGWRTLYDRLFPNLPAEGLVAVRTNASSVHYWAVASGIGIGMLPTYVYAMGAPVVPLDLPVHHQLDIWMNYHAGAAHIPRVRCLIEWLIEQFSPQRYPWFRDEFIAPTRLRREYRGPPLGDPFVGISGARRKTGER